MPYRLKTAFLKIPKKIPPPPKQACRIRRYNRKLYRHLPHFIW